MHLGSTRHGPPRFIKVKEPHVVRIYSPVDVDIKIADIGSEVVGWSSDVLVGLGCVPNRVSGGTRGEWTLLFERKEAILGGWRGTCVGGFRDECIGLGTVFGPLTVQQAPKSRETSPFV